MKTDVFYRTTAGKVFGPLPLASIQVAIDVGRLEGVVEVSATGQDPWREINPKARAVTEETVQEARRKHLMMDCSVCGGVIAKSAQSCPHCGKRFTTSSGLVIAIIIGLVIGLILIAKTCSGAAAIDRRVDEFERTGR